MENDMFWNKGWVCPKCGAVMSPTTSMCKNCRGNKSSFLGYGTNIDVDWAKQTITTITEKEIKRGELWTKENKK